MKPKINTLRFITCLLLTIFAFIQKDQVFAANFTADYDVDYSVAPTGTTIVTQKISLTNNETNLYPKQYMVTIDTTNIKNVIAYDNKGMITPKIEQKDSYTEITLSFNDQVVGKGKTLPFELRYEQGDIAEKHGNIWEITIPGIKDDEAIGTYEVSLRTPPNFGTSAYMKPPPANGRKWTKTQMVGGGISAAFGSSQQFTADLAYDIQNSKLTTAIYEIALPPDTAFQKIRILSLDPKPLDTKKDSDGNWMATYELAGQEKIRVTAKLDIETYVAPRSDFQEKPVNTAEYLTPKLFWESDDEALKKIASQLHTAKDVFQYVVGALSYNYNRVNTSYERRGAKLALRNPTDALCMEFTDLYIALARAAGIPSREAVGYAYTTNTKLRPTTNFGDILHAWPEYYDTSKNLWIPVDPTWTKTTNGVDYFDVFDFNHITFVIHGVSSDYPYPAGSFQEGSIPKKNVTVVFADKALKDPIGTLETTIEIPSSIIVGTTLSGSVKVKNTSGMAATSVHTAVFSEPFSYEVTHDEELIPPYGSISIPIEIPTYGIWAKGDGRVVATTNGTITSASFHLAPRLTLILPMGCIIIGFLLFLWTIFKKH